MGVVACWLACSAGCSLRVNGEACAEGLGWFAPCESEAGSAEDAGVALDAGADAEAPHDAGELELDASEMPERDAAPDAAPDAGPEPTEDAATPDAGETQLPQTLELQGDLGVHDPTIIKVDGRYVIFATGPGIVVKRSTDLVTWQDAGSVFATNPAWIAQQVPGATHLWAPDIAYFNGKYHLYYSASTFGSRNSCIGHATASDLEALDFEDLGPVICTRESDDYNAIDPAFVVDEAGTPWLSFGSFWSGIKLIKLDAEGQRDGTDITSLASRDAVAAIEAPYMVRRNGYYYLFVSFDLCCSGTASTYRIMVGRSKDVKGPYVDAAGKPMLSAGGGSMVVLGNQRWRGPGHNAVLTVGDEQYLVYHAYDAERGGAATLRITELLWDSAGWPVPAGP